MALGVETIPTHSSDRTLGSRKARGGRSLEANMKDHPSPPRAFPRNMGYLGQMAKPLRKKLFYTSTDVARMCASDTKTVHMWAEKGKIETFRTPGHHIRVTHSALVSFLTKYGYPLPEELRGDLTGVPAVAIGANDAGELAPVPGSIRSGSFPTLKVGGRCQDQSGDQQGTVSQLYPNTAMVKWDGGVLETEHPRELLVPM